MPNSNKFDVNNIDSLAIDIGCFESKEAIETLENYFLPLCLKIAASMIKSYKINLNTSEPGDYLIIIHETLLKSAKAFNPFYGDFKTYFLASFVTNLYAEFEQEYSENVALFNSISLDAYLSESTRTYHDIIPAQMNEDPRYHIDYAEAKALIFSDTKIMRGEVINTFQQTAKMRLQKQLILLKYYGCTVDEMTKIFGVSRYVIKRLMFDDSSYMPLRRLKKIFNKN